MNRLANIDWDLMRLDFKLGLIAIMAGALGFIMGLLV